MAASAVIIITIIIIAVYGVWCAKRTLLAAHYHSDHGQKITAAAANIISDAAEAQ